MEQIGRVDISLHGRLSKCIKCYMYVHASCATPESQWKMLRGISQRHRTPSKACKSWTFEGVRMYHLKVPSFQKWQNPKNTATFSGLGMEQTMRHFQGTHLINEFLKAAYVSMIYTALRLDISWFWSRKPPWAGKNQILARSLKKSSDYTSNWYKSP